MRYAIALACALLLVGAGCENVCSGPYSLRQSADSCRENGFGVVYVHSEDDETVPCRVRCTIPEGAEVAAPHKSDIKSE